MPLVTWCDLPVSLGRRRKQVSLHILPSHPVGTGDRSERPALSPPSSQGKAISKTVSDKLTNNIADGENNVLAPPLHDDPRPRCSPSTVRPPSKVLWLRL